MVNRNSFDIPEKDEVRFRDFAAHQSQEYDVRITITTEVRYGWLFWKRVVLLVEYEGKNDWELDALLELASLTGRYFHL